MSGHEAPLIASWPLTGPSGPAVVRATLEATARRVTRLSMGGDRPPREATGRTEPVKQVEPAEPVEPAGVAGSDGILRQQVESLLESAGPIVSAHIVLDNIEGCRIHVLATAELSRPEVSRMVITLLEEGLALRVRSDQITVAQSRLSREELERISPPYVAEYTRPCLVGLFVPPRSRGPPHRGQDGREAGGRRTYRGKRRLV